MKLSRILISAAAVIALGSCANDPSEKDKEQGNGEVRIVCSFEDNDMRLDQDFDLKKSTFVEGDMISVDVMRRPIYNTGATYPEYGSPEYYLNNYRMEYRNGEWVFLNAAIKIFLQPGYKYDYYAYYPAVTGISDPATRQYVADGTGSGGGEGTIIRQNDLMGACDTTSGYDQTVIHLKFKHHLALFEIRQLGLGSNATVKLKSDGDIITNGTFNVGKNEFTTGGASWALPTPINDLKAKEVSFKAMSNGRYMLFLPPQQISMADNPFIEICYDPANPTDENTMVFYPDVQGSPTWDFNAGSSSFKTYPADIDPNLMYTPNTIIYNRRSGIKSVPLGKAYAMWMNDQALKNTIAANDLFGNMTLELLWSDIPKFEENFTVKIDDAGKGAKARLTVEAKNNAQYEGNAVYGLKIGGKLRWSWHIWVCSTKDPEALTATHNGFTFMSENLGALPGTATLGGKRGLLYQWGRKDPFIGAAYDGWDFSKYQPVYNLAGDQINGEWLPGTLDPTTSTGTPNPAYAVGVEVADMQTIAEVVQKPTVFSSTWNAQSMDLWKTAKTDKKSPYDPCPLGWRVPSDDVNSPWYLAGAGSALTDYTTATWNNGINFNIPSYNLGLYAQTNFRSNTDGAMPVQPEQQALVMWSAGAVNSFMVTAQPAPGNTQVLFQDAPKGIGAAIRCVKDETDTQTW